MDKTRMTLRLPADLTGESARVAEQLGISLNAFIVLAVRNWTTYQRRQLAPQVATPRSRQPAPSPVAKVGPNQPCPCGSGQKYKRCHGKPGT